MNVFELKDPSALRLRTHPWTTSESNPAHRYRDFCAHPELIRTSLEDLTPWQTQPAIQTFFEMIEWLNGPESALESNDCSFTGVIPNTGTHESKRLEASGRVMVLFRDLEANRSPDRVGSFTQEVAMALHQLDPGMEGGAVGVSIVDVHFTALPGEVPNGQQLMLSFWAWGDDRTETWAGLEQTLGNLFRALRSTGAVGKDQPGANRKG